MIELLPVVNIDPNTATLDELIHARNTIIKALDSKLLKYTEIVNNIKEIISPSIRQEYSSNIQVVNIYSGGAYNFNSLGNYVGPVVNNILVTENLITEEISNYESIVDDITNYGQIKWIVAVKNVISNITKLYVYFEDEKVAFNILRQGIALKYSISKCLKLTQFINDTK